MTDPTLKSHDHADARAAAEFVPRMKESFLVEPCPVLYPYPGCKSWCVRSQKSLLIWWYCSNPNEGFAWLERARQGKERVT